MCGNFTLKGMITMRKLFMMVLLSLMLVSCTDSLVGPPEQSVVADENGCIGYLIVKWFKQGELIQTDYICVPPKEGL